MELRIFDVEHGFCAALTDGDYLALIDCGHNSNNGLRPLEWLYAQGYRNINALIISNFDQDHISDIQAVRDNFTVDALAVNPSVSPESLYNIKIQGGAISEQMKTLLASMQNNELNTVFSVPYQNGNVRMSFYWVRYPHESDTNNLSLVSFIRFGTGNIIYPGDLETAGWKLLLQNPNFIAELKSTNVYIASHHGRSNGYHQEVFDFCTPEIVIISDQERKFSTQEHDLYSKHTTGIHFGVSPGKTEVRRVLTTRNDGHLTISEVAGMSYISRGL